MQSLEAYAKEFLKEKETLLNYGYEVIGTKSDVQGRIYVCIRKKDSNCLSE